MTEPIAEEPSLLSIEHIEDTVRRSTKDELKNLLLARLKLLSEEQIRMKAYEIMANIHDEVLKKKITDAFLLAKEELEKQKNEQQTHRSNAPTTILQDAGNLAGKSMNSLGESIKEIPVIGEKLKYFDNKHVWFFATGIFAGIAAYFAFRKGEKEVSKQEKHEESSGFFGGLWKGIKYLWLWILWLVWGKFAIDKLAEAFPNNKTIQGLKKGIDDTIQTAKDIWANIKTGFQKIGEGINWIADNKIWIAGTIGALVFRKQIGTILRAPGQFMEMVKAGRMLKIAKIEKWILKAGRPNLLRRVGKVGIAWAVIFGAGMAYEYFDRSSHNEKIQKELESLQNRLEVNHERSNIHVTDPMKAEKVNQLIENILKHKSSLEATDWQEIFEQVRDFTYQVRLPGDRDGFEEYVVSNGVIVEIRYVSEAWKVTVMQVNSDIH